jgi:cell division protein FtsQ
MIKWIKIFFWCCFFGMVVVVLSLTTNSNNEVISKKPNIYIKVDGENAFLTENELYTRLVRKGFVYPNQKLKNVKIKEIEKDIKNMSEIRKVKVYKSIGGEWNIDVELRKPIARIFNKFGETFYLDDLGFTMATSYLYTARVVVVSGDIPDKKSNLSVAKIINNQSLKTNLFLDDIYRISYYVCNNPFLNAQIGQIHLDKNGDFVLIPQIGDHKIIFGTAKNEAEVERKFKKLMLFYEEGLPFEGWNKYDMINLKYEKQIVCKRK